ncbi:MAG: hypothetical protein ABID79_03655 [Elusimicrobiota bacterium]
MLKLKINILLCILYFTFCILFFTGCSKPTYPKDKLSEATQKILKKEYNLDSSVKLVGSTLYLEINLPELISIEKNLPKKIFKKIEDALLTIVRISLSSDAKISTLVTVAKTQDYDFCVRIIQRLEDIKALLYLKISRSDYEERLILEILPYSKLNYRDLTLDEFAARLIVSQYNILLKINPFLSGLLDNALLEFNNLANGSLIIMVNSSQINISITVKKFFEKILVKSYLSVLKKYDILDFPKSIKIIDKNKIEIMIIKT